MTSKEKKTGTLLKKSYPTTATDLPMSKLNSPTNNNSTTSTLPKDRKMLGNLDLASLTLHQVAREGNVELMEKLLERVPNVNLRKKKLNAKDDGKLSPLHYAARYNHYDMINFLLSNGANAQIKGEDDATPLHYLAKYKKKSSATSAVENREPNLDGDLSVRKDSRSCVKLLVDHGANVNTHDAIGLTPLHQACARNNTHAVRELLQFAALQIEEADQQGMTALHLSCLYGKKQIVELLLDGGANLRCRDKDFTTPLHLCCGEGSIEIAQLLLDKADSIAVSSPWEPPAYSTINETMKTDTLGSRKASANNGINRLKKEDRRETLASLTSKAPPERGAIDLLQATDADKNLPLHLAIENGHLDLVKWCIEQGKKAGITDVVTFCRSQNESCLHLAVQSNDLEIVKLLLSEGVDVNARNTSLITPLMLACQHNAHHIVKYLLDSGADLELKDMDYMTPLIIACRHGHLESITCLIDHEADVTETDKDDKTCLMWAAEENHVEAIMSLLNNEIMKNMIEERDKFNNTALHLASMKGHNDTVKLLLDHRAAADIKNDDDRTTLHMAAMHGHDMVIPNLVGRDRTIINAGDEEANTALHLAALGGNLRSVIKLIQAGSNLEIRNARQWTPLDCAAAYGWEKVAHALLEAGASIQPKGKGKLSPLHLACQRGHVDVVKLLLQWKADVTYRTTDGRNALDFAIDFGQKDCVLALIKHPTWQLSMRNAVINPVTGIMITPMRKLIMKMGDMAMIVCNQCITDNGKKPENDDYAVTLAYDFLDDMYSSTEWSETLPTGIDDEENNYAVYDESDGLTPEAYAYTSNSNTLLNNHPLKVMVSYESESLLLHPVVTGLLNYKWRRFGRYVYYVNLFLYVAFVVVLNSYMLYLPPYYKLDWKKMINNWRELNNSIMSSDVTVSTTANNLNACWYYREDETAGLPPGHSAGNCHTIPYLVRTLRWVILGFSVFNLFRELLQLIGDKLNYLGFTNLVEVTLYTLSLFLTFNYSTYQLTDIAKLTGSNLTEKDVPDLTNFQHATGLRQIWQQEIGAFAVFLSWMVLLLFIQKIPRLGIFVVMFTDILKTFFEFFLLFSFFILAFSFSFHILLGNQHEFETWYEAMLKTIVMMIGELDYHTRFYSASELFTERGTNYHHEVYSRDISTVLFVIFLLVMTIIVMNLLVGLAVGDIIEVQENATLERLGMQVDLALEVEFNLPTFLRKRMSRRKQRIEINKYRNANFIKRFLFSDSDLSLEKVSKVLDEEETEQDEPRTAEDKVLTGLNLLRNKLSDVVSDQADLKEDVRGVRLLVSQARHDSRLHTDALSKGIVSASDRLSTRIDSTRSGLTETTQTESTQTRDKVDGTLVVVNRLKEDLAHTKEEIAVIKQDLEKRMEILQEKLLSRSWEDLEMKVQSCHNRVESTKNEIVESLEELKILLVKEKFMTRV